MAYKDYYTYWKGLIWMLIFLFDLDVSCPFSSIYEYEAQYWNLSQKCLGQYPHNFSNFSKNNNFSCCKNFRYEVQIFFCCSKSNRTRCRSLVMLYYLYTMRRWLSHSGVELPCLVFTTAQRCQSIYKVAFLFSEKCEFTSHTYILFQKLPKL